MRSRSRIVIRKTEARRALGTEDVAAYYERLLREENMPPELPPVRLGVTRWKGRKFLTSKADYYRLAVHFGNDYEFLNDDDRNVWRAHAEGIAQQKIAATYSIHRSRIERIIGRLRPEFNLYVKYFGKIEIE